MQTAAGLVYRNAHTEAENRRIYANFDRYYAQLDEQDRNALESVPESGAACKRSYDAITPAGASPEKLRQGGARELAQMVVPALRLSEW